MNLPSYFISSIRPLLGNDTASFLTALAGDAPVSFRLNPFKSRRNPMDAEVSLEPVPWSRWGFYLKERPAFTFDPLLHTGYYYVQEASSMFVEYLVRELVKKPVVCLDLCAAPGGKSLSLLSTLPAGSLLVSNELVRQRAHILSETVSKCGCANVVVTNNMAKDFSALPGLFDLVLVDAPCSGEGMFRKDETAVKEWSTHNVEMCALRQRDILKDIWPALKPGGLMIYSTCTYNTSENEENALWLVDELGAEFIWVEANKDWGISTSLDDRVPGYRFFPHKTKGEGLFVTLLRKSGLETKGSVSTGSRGKNKKKQPQFVRDISSYTNLILHPGDFNFMEKGNRTIAFPSQYSEILTALDEQLKSVAMGIELGERKGKDFIPSHALAMSCELSMGAFPRQEITYKEAISYLRREAITLKDVPIGYVILTYKGEPLGFMKNLGNRANNLYPNEWRIRSGYLPEKKAGIFIPPIQLPEP